MDLLLKLALSGRICAGSIQCVVLGQEYGGVWVHHIAGEAMLMFGGRR